MKKTFLISCLTAVIGAVLLMIGFTMGGHPSVYWQNGLHVDAQESQTVKIPQVTQIVIKGSDYGGVSIRRGDVAAVKVTAYKSQAAKIEFNHHRLTITGRDHKVVALGNVDDNLHPKPIEVTVPKKTQISQLTIAGYVNVHVNHLTIKNLTDHGKAGLTLANTDVTELFSGPKQTYSDITMTNVRINNALNLNTSGDLTIKDSDLTRAPTTIHKMNGDVSLHRNTWSTVKIVTTDGDISLANEIVKNSLQAQSKDGDINAKITPKPHEAIKATSTHGDISLYGKPTYKAGTAAKYQFNTTNGDIKVYQ